MMRAARIENGIVADLWEVPALDVYGDLYELVKAPEHVQIGATFANGKFTNPPAAPVPIPQSVTMRQARLALLAADKLAGVNTAIAAMTGAAGDAARIEWEFATTVQRNSPLITTLAGSLNLTPVQIDDLFVAAAKL